MRVACVGSCFYVDKAFFCIRSLFLRLYCHFVFGVWCVYLLFNHVSIKKKFIKKLYWKIIFFWFSFSLFTELIDTKTWQIGGGEWSECFICLRVCLLQFWRRTSGWRVRTENSKEFEKLRWCRTRDLFRSQFPVTTGEFELRICCIQSSYLTH